MSQDSLDYRGSPTHITSRLTKQDEVSSAVSIVSTTVSDFDDIVSQESSVHEDIFIPEGCDDLGCPQHCLNLPCQQAVRPMKISVAPHGAEPEMLSTQFQVQSALPIHVQSTYMEGFTTVRARQLCQQDFSPQTLKLVKQAKDKNGSSSIQIRLRDAEIDARRAIAHLLSGYFVELAMDINGNHVVQKCIELLSAQDSLFIFDEILAAGHAKVLQVAKSAFGCRVLERLLERSSSKQHLNALIKILLSKTTDLNETEFGQHVICHLFEHGSTDEQKAQLIENLAEGLLRTDLKRPKYGSKTIYHAMCYDKHYEERVKLASAVLQPERCFAMACEKHRQDGADAVKKALQICHGDPRFGAEVRTAVDFFLQHMEELQTSRGGKTVRKFLIESGLVRCGSGMEFRSTSAFELDVSALTSTIEKALAAYDSLDGFLEKNLI